MKQPDTNKASNGSSGGKGSGRGRGKRRLCWYLNCFVGQDSFLAWNVRETSTRVVGQSCSSFSNGSFLCFARVLQSFFEYEPYPGFHMRVNAKIKTEIKEWQDKKQKKVS
uniref:Uncharacterized protein n=1 Tax=Gossypium raimondii TaxID=29730 RepID=A0A0D2T8G1_GOSRA|nr:hypothetical protein B456_007G038000 [Gossypium raimondii]